MFKISCHCGNIKLSAKQKPSFLTSCNCSICRRVASLWAAYDLAETDIVQGANPLSVYTWGKKGLSFHYCKQCSCITHYIAINENGDDRLAINARMAINEKDIEGVSIRYFDGDDTWKYLT